MTPMSSNPLVSVIVIFLNAEEFIQEAIESVLAQTYKHWELLLVDDGSKDESRDIALRCTERHPEKVRYLEHAGHENRGMSVSRNLGIANATGEYIAFLDADDVWLPHKLQHQVSVLESQPRAAMVYGPTQWWYSWSGNAHDRQRDYIHDVGVQPNTLLQPPALLTQFLRVPEMSPCTCSALMRRKVVEQVGGFEEHFRSLYEDQAFFAKVSLAAPVFVTSQCSARYRQHANSNCSTTHIQHSAARSAFLRWLADYISKQYNVRRRRRLRTGFWPCRYPKLDCIYQRARRGLPGQIWRSVVGFRSNWLSLPLVRNLRCLQFRRLQPLGHGRQRGTPIVRYYWHKYLQKHQKDIRGTVLEIGSTDTILRFGGIAVTYAEGIDLSPHSPEITVVADLSRADHVPSDRYDCFVN